MAGFKASEPRDQKGRWSLSALTKNRFKNVIVPGTRNDLATRILALGVVSAVSPVAGAVYGIVSGTHWAVDRIRLVERLNTEAEVLRRHISRLDEASQASKRRFAEANELSARDHLGHRAAILAEVEANKKKRWRL